MKPRRTSLVFILLSVSFLFGCAQKRPVLYPNYYLKQVGEERAQSDVDECMRFAKELGAKSSSGERVAKETAESAAVGAAAGAAAGAVVDKTGRGAGVGAAGAGAGALARGILRTGEPDPVFRRFVEKCLREKGYEPVGWK